MSLQHIIAANALNSIRMATVRGTPASSSLYIAGWLEGKAEAAALLFPDDIELQGIANECQFLVDYHRRWGIYK